MDSTDNEKIISDGLEALFNLGEKRAEAITELKTKLVEALNLVMPKIIEIDHEMKGEIQAVEKAGIELGENYQNDFGRVTYFAAWHNYPADVDIEGIKKRSKDIDLSDLMEALGK